MQDSQISSEGKSWEWPIKLSTHSGEVHVPPTTLPFPDAEIKSTISEGFQHLAVGCLGQETTKDDVTSLVDAYAHWIMAVSGQRETSFWIIMQETNSSPNFALVVAERASEDDALDWEVHGATGAETTKVEFALILGEAESAMILPDSVRATLSVDRQKSLASLTYRGVSQHDVDMLDTSDLESSLRSTDAAIFWKKELQNFVGCTERPFPTISCDRLVVPAGSSQTLSESLVMSISWVQLETAAHDHHMTSVLPVIRTAFACILAEYIESDSVILADRSLNLPIDETSETLIPILISPDDTARSLFARFHKFALRLAKVPPVSLDIAREILQVAPKGTVYNAVFTHDMGEASSGDSTQPMGISSPCSDAPIELKFHVWKRMNRASHSQRGLG